MNQTREVSQKLLETHIQDPNLRRHCLMVAAAMEAYATKKGADAELWYQTGLLHDLDWEEHPDEHPNLAVNEWLTEYPAEMRQAILAHAPDRTGVKAQAELDRYLFACDELSGFINAYALMRPNGFDGMKASKVRKKLKDVSFAAGVSRDDVTQGFELIDEEPADHISFLIEVFKEME